MRIIGRPRLLLTVLSGVCLLMAGCAAGPSQVSSAAIVGDKSVPLSEVQSEIRWLLDNVDQAKQAQRQRKFDTISRELVRTKVTHELTSVVAAREGLRADPRHVEELLRRNGGPVGVAKQVGVEPQQAREFVVDYVLREQLATRYLDRLSIGMVATLISHERPGSTAKDQALALGRQISEHPEQARELAKNAGGRVVDQRLSLADAVHSGGESGLAASALFGARPGTVVIIQPGQRQTGWFVAFIRDRATAAPAPNPPPQQTSSRVLADVGLRLLQPVAEELGVRVNPRYGVWDQAGMSVAPNENELTGYQLRARTVQP